jgi:hypothetical protein
MVAPDAGTPEAGAGKPPKIAAADSEAAQPDGETAPKKKKKSRKDKDRDKEKEKEKDGASAKAGHGPDSGAAGTNGESNKDNAVLPPSDGTASPPVPPESSKDKEKGTGDDCALAEKDMAREAWRRNWPSVCSIPSTGKAFILVPIKGSIEGETHELRRKPKREARVTLPAGSEFHLTMKQYKVKKLGFKDVSISNHEGGTRLRVKLDPGAGDPVFEIKDGYAKITVATPAKD